MPEHWREREKKKKTRGGGGENLTFALAASSLIHLLLDDIVGVRDDMHRSLLHNMERAKVSACEARRRKKRGKTSYVGSGVARGKKK